jgi:hypothetical protein
LEVFVDTQQQKSAMMFSRSAAPALAKVTTTKTFTKAALATYVANIARLSVGASATLAQGMWNPDFCNSDAKDYAVSVLEDLQMQIDHIRKRVAESRT